MGNTPYLPLFFGDFLASTATWDGEEQALYLLLLGYQWSSGPLPAEVSKLARTLRYDPKTFAKLWKTVGKKFERTADGLVNVRLEAHRVRSEEIAVANKARAKHAAEQRWGNAQSNAPSKVNGSDSHASSIAQSTAPRLAARRCSGDAIQSNPSKKEESSQGGEF